MTRFLVAFFLGILISSPILASSYIGLDVNKIMRLTGAKGHINTKEKVFKVSQLREDLKISMSGVKMIPRMGLTSWVTFKKINNETIIVGDLVLTEDQISPVMRIVLENGLRITSLENHYLWESPKVMFMHIEGSGKETQLALAVGKIFKEINQTSNGNGSFPLVNVDISKTTLQPQKIDSILQKRGTFKDGVYKITFSKKTSLDGNEIGSEMGINTWASFAGSDKEAVVVGDFATEKSILEKVLLSLQKSGIYVVSIHQQASNQDPQIVFLHYVGVGSTQHLAKGIHAALSIKVTEPKKVKENTAIVRSEIINPAGIKIPEAILPIPYNINQTLQSYTSNTEVQNKPALNNNISTSETNTNETTKVPLKSSQG